MEKHEFDRLIYEVMTENPLALKVAIWLSERVDKDFYLNISDQTMAEQIGVTLEQLLEAVQYLSKKQMLSFNHVPASVVTKAVLFGHTDN
jgi:Mor family transcriptional regulator